MSRNGIGQPDYLQAETSLLKSCLPLADRLVKNGVLIELNEQDKFLLDNFEQLLNENLSDKDWSYLRIASGVKLAGVAALTSCLRLYREGNRS